MILYSVSAIYVNALQRIAMATVKVVIRLTPGLVNGI